MFLFKLIERNLLRNLRRTVLTALTVALATFIFLMLVSIPASMDRIIKDSSATLRLIVLNRSLPFNGMPARYCAQVRAMPGCAACVAITSWPATYRDVSDQILAVAEGLEIAQVFPDYDLNGEARRAFARERRGAFAGRVLMKKFGWHPGQHITLRGADRDHLKLDFVILGEMPSRRYPTVFAFRRDYLEDARKAVGRPGADLVLNLVVRVDRAENVAPLARQIDETFRNSDYETRALTESDALAGGLAAIGDLRSIILTLCAVVVLTILLIAANSTAMMVRERTNEVAVMRTLGFSRARIAAMLFGECALIGVLGGILGAGAALAFFTTGIGVSVIGNVGALWVTPGGAFVAAMVAIVVCILSGMVPIVGVLRIPPAMGFGKVI
jgi:putative ABC transport system permease protein